MSFAERWCIKGILTTETPLHIGSGGTTERPELCRTTRDGHSEPIQVAAVATDDRGRAYIPGTTLKGSLHAWARAHGLSEELRQAFGWYQHDARAGHGGRAEFWDAPITADASLASTPPYWSPQRHTGIAASVALSRRTRTASDKRLFHQEYVPADVCFGVTIAGCLTENEVKALLALLEIPGLALGASTGNGWGQMTWVASKISHLDAASVRAWLAEPTSVGYQALRELPHETVVTWSGQAAQQARRHESGNTHLTLDLKLVFDGRFLVNDTSQTQKPPGATDAPSVPAHAPRRDARGHAYLPASSLRGALRSQAERILRTRAASLTVCSPDAPCAAVESLELLRERCPACRVFGASGWRAPVQVSDFVAAHTATHLEATQDFLAIDRFTGSGVDGLKFDARAALRPTLSGRIRVDPMALERAGAWPWALGLLALALRDLVEGDLRLGFGAAKGYGGCRAQVTSVGVPATNHWPPAMLDALKLEARHWPKSGPPTAAPTLDAPLGRAIDAWIKLIPTGA